MGIISSTSAPGVSPNVFNISVQSDHMATFLCELHLKLRVHGGQLVNIRHVTTTTTQCLAVPIHQASRSRLDERRGSQNVDSAIRLEDSYRQTARGKLKWNERRGR